MILNKDYRLTQNSGRTHYRTGVKAYQTMGTQQTEGYRIFHRVKQDYKDNLYKMGNIVGKLESSTGFYN